MSTHVDELVFQPKKHFSRPEEVIEDQSLSHKDKLRILESWKLDEHQLAESTAENMTGGEDTNLRAVSRALVQLKAMETPPEAIQPREPRPIVSGMTIGALLGAAGGLVAAAATTASLALVAQVTVAGIVVGGVVSAVTKQQR